MSQKPTLRVLGPERHVDTEPIAEYWIPKRQNTTPEWVRTYQKLTGGSLIIIGATGITGGMVRQISAMAVTEAAETAGFAMSINQSMFSSGVLLAVVGVMVFSLGVSIMNNAGDAA